MAFSAEPEPARESGTGMRLYWIGSAIALCIGLAYVGWIFYSRWHADQEIEQRIAAQKRAQAEQAFEGMGGSRFDILAFYASPGIVDRGDAATLCYSVSNAKSVALEPKSADPVWPSQERCVDVTPSRTTTYTLTATDAGGHTKSATLVVEVR